jgi:hypothetical protein
MIIEVPKLRRKTFKDRFSKFYFQIFEDLLKHYKRGANFSTIL